ncbi:MAG: hypothetical protein KKE20_00400, partial [Nanoarchaeota archaeon]|nr:hypothetical protein [Nanoarchaeota archaeon]
VSKATKEYFGRPLTWKINNLKSQFSDKVKNHAKYLVDGLNSSYLKTLNLEYLNEQNYAQVENDLQVWKAEVSRVSSFFENHSVNELLGESTSSSISREIPKMNEKIKDIEERINFVKKLIKDKELVSRLEDLNKKCKEAVSWYSTNFFNERGDNYKWFAPFVLKARTSWAPFYKSSGSAFSITEPFRRIATKDEIKEFESLVKNLEEEQRSIFHDMDTLLGEDWFKFHIGKFPGYKGVTKSDVGKVLDEVRSKLKDMHQRIQLKEQREYDMSVMLVSHMTKKLWKMEEILHDGFLASGVYLKNKGERFSGDSPVGQIADLPDISFSEVVELMYGDFGLLFHLPKLLEGNLFYTMETTQLSGINEVHVFSAENPIKEGVAIDIDRAIFVAPKDLLVMTKEGPNVADRIIKSKNYELKNVNTLDEANIKNFRYHVYSNKEKVMLCFKLLSDMKKYAEKNPDSNALKREFNKRIKELPEECEGSYSIRPVFDYLSQSRIMDFVCSEDGDHLIKSIERNLKLAEMDLEVVEKEVMPIADYLRMYLKEVAKDKTSWLRRKGIDPDWWVDKRCYFYDLEEAQQLITKLAAYPTLWGRLISKIFHKQGLDIPRGKQGLIIPTDKIGFNPGYGKCFMTLFKYE